MGTLVFLVQFLNIQINYSTLKLIALKNKNNRMRKTVVEVVSVT